MISAISKFAVNQNLLNISQNTNYSLICETTMKAIGRPGFILIDNNIDQDTKRYAAMKEFLYQATCLAIYAIVVVPLFKKGGYQIAKKIFKNDKGFQHFKNATEYLDYHKLTEKPFKSRGPSLAKNHSQDKFSSTLRNEILNKETPKKFPLVKGAIELASMVGSVIGLAILAPQVSHAIVHPTMKFLGFEKVKKKEALEKALTVKLQVPPEAIKKDEVVKPDKKEVKKEDGLQEKQKS